ncbi:MAG: hypothetical protein WBP93_21490, partial [Pyrinomonadaceae bacterium]
ASLTRRKTSASSPARALKRTAKFNVPLERQVKLQAHDLCTGFISNKHPNCWSRGSSLKIAALLETFRLDERVITVRLEI